MKHLFKGGLAILAGLASAFCAAQLKAPAYSGSFKVDNAPYNGGPILWFSLSRIAAGGMDPLSSAVWLTPEPQAPGVSTGRSMIKFTAGGSGDLSAATWKLPSGDDGGESLGTVGEERVFSTWTPGWCISPPNNHMFASEVSVSSPNTEAWVDVDLQEAPKPFMVSSTGAFTHDYLDGGIYDADPNPNVVVLDRNANPTIMIDFGLPSFDMHRDVVNWQDGSTSNSTFEDQSFSGMLILFEGPTSEAIFVSPYSPSVYFHAGSGAENKTIAAFSGTAQLNISALASGTYDIQYWGIPWSADYTDASGAWGCKDGFVAFSDFELNVQVVPEPGSMAALALGGIALIGRTKRQKTRSPKRKAVRHPGSS